MPSIYDQMKSSNTTQADKSSKRSCKRRYLLWALLAILVLAIVIPIAIMFGKKKKASLPKSAILVPLYVYPAQGAWDPLITAIESHPELNFTIVVNPASGPGAGSGPDANYTREIPRLNAHANARAVGYVSTDYSKRDINAVLNDIAVYSGWSENATVNGLGVRGIFLDETPSQYDAASAEFFETIAASIRSAPGLGDHPLIIHNPGAIPDARFMSSCNVSVVFEGTYSTYQVYGFSKTISSFRSSSKCNRDALACIIHALPTTLSSNDLNALVKDVRSLAGSAFLTGLSVDYYASFWAGWTGFVNEMDK